MWVHLIAVLVFAAVCIIFGLLRADTEEDSCDRTKDCAGCSERSSCEREHFSFRHPWPDFKALFRSPKEK